MSDQELWESFKMILNDEPLAIIRMFQAKDKELQALRDWKARAMPLIKADWSLLNFSHEMVPQNLSDHQKKKFAILTELIKGAE